MTRRAWLAVVIAYALLAAGAFAGWLVLDHQAHQIRVTTQRLTAAEQRDTRIEVGFAGAICGVALHDPPGARRLMVAFATTGNLSLFTTDADCRAVVARARALIRQRGGADN